MMSNSVLESRECPVVKERRLERNITNWRSSEFVSVIGIAGNLLQSEILVLPCSIECDVAHSGSNLRHSNHVWGKIAEHLIRFTRNFVTLGTPGRPKEQQRAFFLFVRERVLLSSRKSVDRGIREDKCEFKLCNSETKLIKVNRVAGFDGRKQLTESFSVFRHTIDSPQYLIADGVVITGETEASHFHSLCRRDERLGHQQVRQVGQR